MRLQRSEWVVVISLLLLSFIPCVGGAIRLIELSLGASFQFLPPKPMISSAPIPVLVHLATAIPYCVLGIAQFLPSLRQRHSNLHRVLGRGLALAGVASVLSGLWMTQFYAHPAEDQSNLLYVVRLTVGFSMLGCFYLGVSYAMKKCIGQHQAWMIRAYALAQGAGTQSLIGIPWVLMAGEITGSLRDFVMTAGWVINALVAECIIRKMGKNAPNREPVQLRPIPSKMTELERLANNL
jgi:uncharacterized membrane protein